MKRAGHPSLQLPPRIAAIHDLSCLGRCALTVIMPTLSVMGFQVIPVPTALLSTHTGGFTDLHFRDLTDDMEGIAAHFSRLGTSFRSIYTGFLGSARQIETVGRFLEAFGSRPDGSGRPPLVLVDPVMGDDGTLYSTYTPALADGIRALCTHAGVITPNLTEACFLTGEPYRETMELAEADALAYANRLLDALNALRESGTGQIVITGLRLPDGTVANLGQESDGSRFVVRREECGCSYPGTGDIFASVLLGKLLGGASFREACDAAAGFVALLIRRSCLLPGPVREGVALEPELWRLAPPHSIQKGL